MARKTTPVKITAKYNGETTECTCYTLSDFYSRLSRIEFFAKIDHEVADFEGLEFDGDGIYLTNGDYESIHIGNMHDF